MSTLQPTSIIGSSSESYVASSNRPTPWAGLSRCRSKARTRGATSAHRCRRTRAPPRRPAALSAGGVAPRRASARAADATAPSGARSVASSVAPKLPPLFGDAMGGTGAEGPASAASAAVHHCSSQRHPAECAVHQSLATSSCLASRSSSSTQARVRAWEQPRCARDSVLATARDKAVVTRHGRRSSSTATTQASPRQARRRAAVEYGAAASSEDSESSSTNGLGVLRPAPGNCSTASRVSVPTLVPRPRVSDPAEAPRRSVGIGGGACNEACGRSISAASPHFMIWAPIAARTWSARDLSLWTTRCRIRLAAAARRRSSSLPRFEYLPLPSKAQHPTAIAPRRPASRIFEPRTWSTCPSKSSASSSARAANATAIAGASASSEARACASTAPSSQGRFAAFAAARHEQWSSSSSSKPGGPSSSRSGISSAEARVASAHAAEKRIARALAESCPLSETVNVATAERLVGCCRTNSVSTSAAALEAVLHRARPSGCAVAAILTSSSTVSETLLRPPLFQAPPSAPAYSATTAPRAAPSECAAARRSTSESLATFKYWSSWGSSSAEMSAHVFENNCAASSPHRRASVRTQRAAPKRRAACRLPKSTQSMGRARWTPFSTRRHRKCTFPSSNDALARRNASFSPATIFAADAGGLGYERMSVEIPPC
mmetsp:Transcript_30807/g.106511  ORF Transcript_30807/g.106511 Transcript_30807/m.106511 type:complete len:665 (-) Transcript_30807:790-2784(-)